MKNDWRGKTMDTGYTMVAAKVVPNGAKTVEEYLKLPYAIEVMRDEGDDYGGWFAQVLELPGCMTQADTFAEIDVMIQDAMRAWIETALEKKIPIPEPRAVEQYSGKFVVRVPRSLHKTLVEAADRDGVSLNAYVNVSLAQVVGASSPR
jgi:antitoxin HicB